MHLMVRILGSILTLEDALIANVIFHKVFWHLKVSLFLCFWVNQVYIFSSLRNIFVSFHIIFGGFHVLLSLKWKIYS